MSVCLFVGPSGKCVKSSHWKCPIPSIYVNTRCGRNYSHISKNHYVVLKSMSKCGSSFCRIRAISAAPCINDKINSRENHNKYKLFKQLHIEKILQINSINHGSYKIFVTKNIDCEI